jgi:hypothetical protein
MIGDIGRSLRIIVGVRKGFVKSEVLLKVSSGSFKSKQPRLLKS